ncbi:unnamed protein product [Oncorhynchus mykiss]|uniref:Uncharacterized protein n=1 Tax=Oncorhynchus mykiss TaxID=8022 RepID=A0A060XET4_ONCMY|nr:unnamed protein product [Oncorhynchus mykiss]
MWCGGECVIPINLRGLVVLVKVSVLRVIFLDFIFTALVLTSPLVHITMFIQPYNSLRNQVNIEVKSRSEQRFCFSSHVRNHVRVFRLFAETTLALLLSYCPGMDVTPEYTHSSLAGGSVPYPTLCSSSSMMKYILRQNSGGKCSATMENKLLS